ncbi:MAG: hypothetical protein HGA96_01290 [Desulfobulbaceae bacterium]|nr:hypothetical protein [Desulfobulbaceae bacterium]
MRPALVLALCLLVFAVIDSALFWQSAQRRTDWPVRRIPAGIATSSLGLTDLCLATEARYTRHPAVSDPLAPFMDHPGSLEHFPTGSFWAWPGVSQRGGTP